MRGNGYNRRAAPMQKHGSAAAGTAAAHIMSHEVMKQCIGGKNYSDAKNKRIVTELNSNPNLRIKTNQGNLYGSNGYSGDRYYDKQIISAMKGTTPSQRILTSQGAVDRAQRQYEMVQHLNLDKDVKIQVRQNFSQLKDQSGHSIVRANAPLSK